MISAVKNKKTPIKLREDTLTSVVFDNLLHLPNNLFWKIIKESCFENNLPCFINSIDSYEFWPSWYTQNSNNEYKVEPDLFIRFDNFDLIIEAKLNLVQDLNQWKDQFIGYNDNYNQYKQNKNVYLLAIGGINDENEIEIKVNNYGSIKVVKCRWSNILEKLVSINSILVNYNFLNIDNIIRIINTIIAGLEMHGFEKIHWLEDMINNTCDIDFESSFKSLLNWRIESNGWV